MVRKLVRSASRVLWTLLLGVSILVLPGLPGRPAAAQGPAWTFQCADCPKQLFITEHSLQLDAQGRSHIAYGGDHLYYASPVAYGWLRETVDRSPQVGQGASLAFDVASRPHISYLDAANNRLLYTVRDAAGWHVEPVADVGKVDPYDDTSLALDPDGYAHISYVSSGLMYAYQDASGWHVEAVPGAEGAYSGSSLALNSDGYPYIYPYIAFTQGGLKLAHRGPSGWSVEAVPGAEGAVERAALALDGAGQPHIVYANDNMNTMTDVTARYAHRDGNGWHVETIDRVHNIGIAPSLAVDNAGRVHVSYYDYTDATHQVFKYARRDGSGWHPQILDDTIPFAGYRSSMAVNEFGMAFVAYTGTYYNNLYYADTYDVSGTPVTWYSQEVDRSGYAGQGNSLALDPRGLPHVSYLDQSDLTVRYAYGDPGGWHREVVDQVTLNSQDTALVLDGEGRPYITYSVLDVSPVRFGAVKYAYQDVSGWHLETVAEGPGVFLGSAVALDGDGRPCVTYYEYGLQYACRDAAGWHAETLSTWTEYLANPGDPPSLAMDSHGFAHMSYRSPNSQKIEHVYQDAAGWHADAVSGGLSVGPKTSLALDAQDHAHIAFFSGPTSGVLRYAHEDEAGWQLEEVPDAPNTQALSLALNEAGLPVIACTGPDSALYYLYRQPSGWQIEIAEGARDAGEPVSLALDARGDPNIAYRVLEGDLEVARGHLHADLSPSGMEGQRGAGQGGRLAYTIQLVNAGRVPAAFTLTDPIPALTTYVPGSAWASGGAIDAGQGITWTGTISAFGHLTATLAVTVESTLPQPAMITNVATLEGDPLGPLTLKARNVVNGLPTYVPILMREE